MQKAITVFTISALVSLETSAVRVEAEAELGRMTQEQKNAWLQFWETKQLEYSFGTENG